MGYKLEPLKKDLGETSIENIFINIYLPRADEIAIKVYLYAYSYAKNFKPLTDEIIASALNISLEDVNKAWIYWFKEGIVKKEINPHTREIDYCFLSLREVYLGITALYEYEEIEKPLNSGDFKKMFEQIEDIIGLELTISEINAIMDYITTTGQQKDLIVEGFKYSNRVSGKKNVHYVLGILRNWKINGINTIEDLKRESEKKRNKFKTKNIQKPKKIQSNVNISVDKSITSDKEQFFNRFFKKNNVNEKNDGNENKGE